MHLYGTQDRIIEVSPALERPMRPCGPAILILLALFAASNGSAQTPLAELDTFMQQVLARRDDNWRKIQQYILDEQERVEFRGPAEVLLWGQKREYMWYPKDGFFVRSPVRFNGEAIGERERQRYEENFLRRAKSRDARDQRRNAETEGTVPTPGDVQGLLQQTRDPQFISSAYFLKFKFEGGQYALVGRETIEDVPVLRIEYYPTRLFSDDPSTRAEARTGQVSGRNSRGAEYGQAVQQMMNKVSLVTLWIEPNQKQIVKYTFDNIGLDFLPAAWLVRVTDLRANMTMTEAFSGVWLPKRVDMAGFVSLAGGAFSIAYDIQYSGYREATTGTKYLGPKGR
jgi:hypothetical protein